MPGLRQRDLDRRGNDHLYAVKFGLQGIGALVEAIVSAELDRRDV